MLLIVDRGKHENVDDSSPVVTLLFVMVEHKVFADDVIFAGIVVVIPSSEFIPE